MKQLILQNEVLFNGTNCGIIPVYWNYTTVCPIEQYFILENELLHDAWFKVDPEFEYLANQTDSM